MMYSARALCPVLFLVVAAFATAADNWPVFRGNGQDGVEKDGKVFENGYGLEIAWQKDAGSGYSSISISDGLAVHMFSDGTHDVAAAYDAGTGKEIWRYRISEHYKGHDGSHDGTIATPVIDQGAVYGLNAHGHLFALELTTGKEIWKKHMADDLKGVSPSYGFSSSPLVAGDVLVVQTGGKGAAVTGLNKKSGEVLWTVGDDTVNYQSPVHTLFLGKKQIMGAGDNKLFGIDPQNGRLLWEHEHAGKSQIYDPIIVDGDKIFAKVGGGIKLLKSARDGEGYVFEEAWSSNEIRSQNISVHHEGYLYGYSGKFLACVDAKDGKRIWKARQPGDGFLILVDGHLVILTKKGTLHLAEASPEGYKEKSSIKVFDSLAHTPPSFAEGKVFVRNLKSIAAVDIGKATTTKIARKKSDKGLAPKSDFAAWVKKVEAASDKTAMVDAFMEKQSSFPVIEKSGYAHVIYRGPAKDVAISGDMLESNEDQVLRGIAGTDLAYYSFALDPDAHISYQLSIDFGQAGGDPLNPRQVKGFQGETFSMLTMPGYADRFPEETEPAGKVKEIEFESTVTAAKRKAWVYLPPGYRADRPAGYPAVYVTYGKFAYENGKVNLALDQAVGKTAAPMIVVFVDLHPEHGFGELRGENYAKYMEMMAEELVPEIDKRYHTQTDAAGRTSMGYSSAGFTALETGLRYPKVFGKVAAQSVNFDKPREETLNGLLADLTDKPQQIVIEWGRYDLRNKGNDLDFSGRNRKLLSLLKDKGLNAAGGERAHGYGWGSWATRTQAILGALYPPGP